MKQFARESVDAFLNHLEAKAKDVMFQAMSRYRQHGMGWAGQLEHLFLAMLPPTG